jgi:hypothetical protein
LIVAKSKSYSSIKLQQTASMSQKRLFPDDDNQSGMDERGIFTLDQGTSQSLDGKSIYSILQHHQRQRPDENSPTGYEVSASQERSRFRIESKQTDTLLQHVYQPNELKRGKVSSQHQGSSQPRHTAYAARQKDRKEVLEIQTLHTSYNPALHTNEETLHQQSARKGNLDVRPEIIEIQPVSPSPQPDDEESNEPIVMAIVYGKHRIGCAFSHINQLFLVPDMEENAFFELVKMLIYQVEPHVVLVPRRLDDALMKVLEQDIQELELERLPSIDKRPASEFNFASSLDKLLNCKIRDGPEIPGQEEMSFYLERFVSLENNEQMVWFLFNSFRYAVLVQFFSIFSKTELMAAYQNQTMISQMYVAIH